MEGSPLDDKVIEVLEFLTRTNTLVLGGIGCIVELMSNIKFLIVLKLNKTNFNINVVVVVNKI